MPVLLANHGNGGDRQECLSSWPAITPILSGGLTDCPAIGNDEWLPAAAALTELLGPLRTSNTVRAL